MNKNSKIYVAGHGGLVGSALVRTLHGKGYNNLVFRTFQELDLRRQKETEESFKKERPEYVFLAAAKVGGILANSTYTAEFIYDNIMIAANVINSAYRYGVKKLLNLGSACIYPKYAPQPMKEEYLLSGELEPTNEPYAIAKIAALKLCRYYNQQYKTNFISVMPNNLYGPADNFNLQTSHILPALIRKFYLAKLLREKKDDLIKQDLLREPIGFGLDEKVNRQDINSVKKNLCDLGITENRVTLWGSGRPFREFLYVDDLADACIFVMERYNYQDLGEVVNIGTGKEIAIKDLAGLIKSTVGFTGEILWDARIPDGMHRKLLDISKITGLGWSSKTSLRQGLEKLFKSYIDRHRECFA